MAKILINDGIHPVGYDMLVECGHEVTNQKIDQSELAEKLQEYDAICIRSATKVRKELIDVCPRLKLIARGGVGLDNIDVDHAQAKGIKIINTPEASSRSVAELTMAHILSISRFLFQSNRMMPEDGDNNFKGLKKAYSNGMELENKTIGIVGFGRIGQATAKLALGLGMKVLAVDPYVSEAKLKLIIGNCVCEITVHSVSLDEMLSKSDIIVLHTPILDRPVIGREEFEKMKTGTILVNTARGGCITEDDLLEALDNGKIIASGLDVFENEPNPRMDLLQHPRVSLTPHIGASTIEAQEKIGKELARKIIDFFHNST